MHAPLRIAIIGGGPGGLTLARILHVNGIAASVFERETGPLERPQGGTLDLHEESGQYALARAGLDEAFKAIARYEDQGERLLDMSGRVVFEDAGSAQDNRPEVDRTALRALLLDALPDTCVHWGHAVREVQPQSDGTWRLLLDDCSADDSSTQGPFDLVVGADGAWSKIRPLLSPYKPQYSGLTFIEFGIDDIDDRHPALSRLVGRGKLVVEGDGKKIIAQRNGNAHVRGYAVFRVPIDWANKRFDFTSPAAVRAGLLKEFAGYTEQALDLFRASNDTFMARAIHALPIGHCWPHVRGLTLIGDAAHVMSPFGGEGVNAAMLDAAELARALIETSDWNIAVREFEAAMFARVTDIAEGSADAAATELSHDGLVLTAEEYRSHRLREAIA